MTWRPLAPLAKSPLPAVVLPQPTELQRNVMLDLTAALGVGSAIAVVAALLPAVARRGGLDPMGLAALAALPFLASLLGVLAGRIGPRTPSQLAVFRALGSAGLLLVLVAPQPLFIGLAAFAFWATLSLGGPTQQRLWTSMYPKRDRGRLLGIIGSGRSAAAMAALLAFTFVTTRDGWLPILAVVAIIGIGSAIATTRLTLADGSGSAQPRYGARESVLVVWRRPTLRRITITQLVFGAGMVAAGAFIALVQVDRLDLSFGDVALAGLMGALATTLTFGGWGRLAGRTGAQTTMTLGTLLGAASLATFALAQDATMIILASLLLGAHQSAIDASWPLLIADHAEPEEQAAAAAGLGAIMGFRGLLVPFLFMVPLHLGLIDETGGLLLCTGVATVGALLWMRLSGLGARLVGVVRSGAAVGVVRSGAPVSRDERAAEAYADSAETYADAAEAYSGPAEAYSSPASALMPASSSSGWPVIRRSRLMRSTMAGWVLKRPMALLSSFLTGLTT